MEKVISDNKLTLEQQKELYVATLVHDLKNPLNAQIIALEQFYNEKFGGLTFLQKEILNDIISSAKFMREMLSSLLSIYKFENGTVRLNKTIVNIDNLIKICLKDIIPLSDENCILLEYKKFSKLNTLLCDEGYLRRVISNMLNNIVIYSYKNTKACISLEEDDLYLIVRFKSKGFPINDDLKCHIFEKYTSGIHKNSGTGLGLYFCKKVVEAHGGIIALNTKNSDIEFYISLPKSQKEENIIKFV